MNQNAHCHFDIRLFGKFQALKDGNPIKGLKQREGEPLLAYLILNSVIPGESVLLEEIRSRVPGLSEGNALSNALSSLYKALGVESVKDSKHETRLILPSANIDLIEFERCLEAPRTHAALKRAIRIGEREFLEGWEAVWVKDLRKNHRSRLENAKRDAEKAAALVRPISIPMPPPPLALEQRKNEVKRIIQLLQQNRLVTITGLGGMGKTTLAHLTAMEAADMFHDGVRWLSLDAATAASRENLNAEAVRHEVRRLEEAVSEAIDASGASGQSLTDKLCGDFRLQSLERLIVLDNCEDMVKEGGAIVDLLLRSIPNLRILATSRTTFGLPEWEAVYPASPFSRPSIEIILSPDEAMEYEAVRYYARCRSISVRGTYEISETNVSAVIQLCEALAGMPFALRLAASASISPGELLKRLRKRNTLPMESEAVKEMRLVSFENMMDCSLEALSNSERLVLQRTGVFAGPWDLEAAEAVCADGTLVRREEVLQLMSQLVRKWSLVEYREETVAPEEVMGSYHLLPPVREHIRHSLNLSGEVAMVRQRYKEYYSSQLHAVEGKGRDGAWALSQLSRLVMMMPNISEVLRQSLDEVIEEEGFASLLRLVSVAMPDSFPVPQALELMETLLAHPFVQTRDSLHAEVLCHAANLYATHCTPVSIQHGADCCRKALDYGQESESVFVLGASHFYLGHLLWAKGQDDAAESHYIAALDLAVSHNKLKMIDSVKRDLAKIAWTRGRIDEAERVLLDIHSRAAEDTDAYGFIALNALLGNIASLQGRQFESSRYLLECVSALSRLAAKHIGAYVFEFTSELLSDAERHEAAAEIYGAAEASRRAHGNHLPPVLHPMREAFYAKVGSGLGRVAFEKALNRGRAMTWRIGLAHVNDALLALRACLEKGAG